jgi:hypothetical protein
MQDSVLRIIIKYSLPFLFFQLCWDAHLAAQSYAMSLLPDSLKRNANCVLREYTSEIALNEVNKGTEKVHKVITVLNKEGEAAANLAILYDKNVKVKLKKILFYDSEGKQKSKVAPSSVEGVPFYNSALFSDDKLLFYQPVSAEYPYTIEYQYEKEENNMISYGYWFPVGSFHMAVQHAQLSISYPSDIKVHKKEMYISASAVTQKGASTTESWEVNNLHAVFPEPFNSGVPQQMPRVYLMPSVLKYDGHNGNINNWQEYGKWVGDLYRGRDDLDEKTKKVIQNLVNAKTDTLECIQVLYKYMQEHTRYVNIQLGIGGYQPFDAKTVAENGFGDCKALSNYMHALLNTIGVKSYPALVSSGRYIEPIFQDFPNFHQFNHVILCVLYKKDTLWLECTSQQMPFAFLGDFTDDRDVLLITEKGGIFAHTKKYGVDENKRCNNAEFSLDSLGNVHCSMKTYLLGLQYDEISSILEMQAEEQKKWLYEHTKLPSMKISAFSIQQSKSMLPYAAIEMKLLSKKYASISGKYMIFPLNLVNAQESISKMLRTRHEDISIDRSYADYDTLKYKLPENYTVESLPQGNRISSKFGEYTYTVSLKDNVLIYIRSLVLRQGQYPPTEYLEFYNFLQAISKEDNIKVMLTKR